MVLRRNGIARSGLISLPTVRGLRYTRACAMLACCDEPMARATSHSHAAGKRAPRDGALRRTLVHRPFGMGPSSRASFSSPWGSARRATTRSVNSLAGRGAERSDDSHRHGPVAPISTPLRSLCHRLRPLQWRLLSHHGCGAVAPACHHFLHRFHLDLREREWPAEPIVMSDRSRRGRPSPPRRAGLTTTNVQSSSQSAAPEATSVLLSIPSPSEPRTGHRPPQTVAR